MAAAAPARAAEAATKEQLQCEFAQRGQRWELFGREWAAIAHICHWCAADADPCTRLPPSPQVAVTGRKEQDKLYHRHTVGRPGGWKIETLAQLRARIPERVLEKAVKGMLPKGRMGRHLFTHLKVFRGTEHPHTAQQPVDITHRISKKPGEIVAAEGRA